MNWRLYWGTLSGGFLVYAALKMGELTWDSVVAVILAAVFAIPALWYWGKGQWGKFGLRWLEPNAVIDPDTDRPSRLIRLFPAGSIARFSLRPNIAIFRVTVLSFSALQNRRYPRRLWMSATSKFVMPPRIVATHIRKHVGGDNWEPWQAIPAPGPGERTARWVCGIHFTSGSRQVFEVAYQIQESLIGWDGILGVEVSYEANGNGGHAYVNSKAFVSSAAKCTPLTFRFRRVNSARLGQPTPDKAGSQP